MPAPSGKAKRPNLVSVTTINADGSHHILHPADVRGKFTRARFYAGLLLIVIYAALPWIPVNGAPALFLDLEHRRFHAFGLTLLAQDLWVLFFLMSGLGFFLFFITSILGRVWCGWACPYTVFLEHVFRRIERLVDGDASARRKLDAAPSSFAKISRRTFKTGLYLFASTLIAHVFVSYFVSLPRLYEFMLQGPFRNPGSFLTVISLTAALYYCFAHFREQFCIILCPYGRIQSALTDDDTVVIGYDGQRGEPRGKATDPTAGSCVDCRRCVQVCPTGIDIRNGLQMECIGCAACIDACDDIMTKLRRPTGLVRYDSMRGLAGKKRRVLRPRIHAYALLALLGMIAMGTTVYFKARPFHAEVSRMRGPSFYTDELSVRNHYQLRLTNKRNRGETFNVSLENPPAGFTLSGVDEGVVLGPLSEAARALVVLRSKEKHDGPVLLSLVIRAEPGGQEIRQKFEFLGPNPRMLKKSKTEP